MMSERDGYNHLYLYTIGGNLIKQVTKGKFEVKDFLGWDKPTNTFYYTSNEESPLRTAVYKTDAKGKTIKLSTRTGTNSAIFSTNLSYYINNFSNIDTPTLITINNNKGKELTTLLDNSKLKSEVATLNMPKKEFFSFRTAEGVELNGWMMKPANFDPSKKYPVIMHQTADRVRSRYSTDGASEASVMEACSKLTCATKVLSWYVSTDVVQADAVWTLKMYILFPGS